MAILLFTFWASEKLPSTLFFFPNSVDSPEEFLFMISVKFYRAHLHHFLSALALIAKLLIYLKWKKESRRKEKQASVGAGQCFPNVLSPCVRVRLVHWRIPQTCSNLWGRAVGVHSLSRGNTRGNQGENHAPQQLPYRRHVPSDFFSQDISMLLILLHILKTAYVLESSSLVLDSGHSGGALMALQRLQLQEP